MVRQGGFYMILKKGRIFIALLLVFLFTAGIAVNAMAKNPDKAPNKSKAHTAVKKTIKPAVTAAGSTVMTSTGTAAVTTPDTIIIPGLPETDPSKIRQQYNMIKKLCRTLPPGQFKKLLNEEVDKPKKPAQKKKVANARQGVILKIDVASNGKTVLLIRRGDISKLYDNYFTVNLDLSKTLVYDRTLKAQKTFADIQVGDVVRIIPVKGSSLTLIDKIGHREVQTVPITTGDTLTVTPTL